MFDTVWNHFVVNKGPRSAKEPYREMGSAGRCLYRGQDGAKCAIGLFIPDERYHSEFDMIGAPGMRVIKDETLHDIIEQSITIETLRELQRCHDDTYTKSFHETIEINLRQFAKRYKLTCNI